MRKYKDKVDWYSLSYSQKFSENFVIEYLDYIYLDELILNKKCKFSNNFWRTIFTLKPEWEITYTTAVNMPYKFDINFVREFRNQFQHLTGRLIDSKSSKIWKEMGIKRWS